MRRLSYGLVMEKIRQMDDKSKLSRRDFLKAGGIGSLALMSLPAVSVVGCIGNNEVVTSDEYGGFYVRRHAKDNPPYDVDNSVYKRFDAKNTGFARMIWDREYQQEIMPFRRSAKEMIAEGKPGFRREDYALGGASLTVAEAFGSGTGGTGMHRGLFQVEPFYPYVSADAFEGEWDRSHLSDEDVTRMVKTAAMFNGASLVGIAELDERFIYSKYFDFRPGFANMGIVSREVTETNPTEGIISPKEAANQVRKALTGMEPEKLKQLIIETMQSADPTNMQEGAGPNAEMLKAMPAAQVTQMLRVMFGSMSPDMIKLFVEKLELPFNVAETEPVDTTKPRYEEDGTFVIPKTMNRVIVLAFEMDYDAIACSHSTTENGATGNGYSRMAFTAASLAEFIRELGFNAIPCGNNTGLSVPMAIDAGLGELGRQGVVITPKYGPRVRLAKVITDMPLLTDSPISFGVTEFCEICGKCAKDCPGGAISFEGRVRKGHSISNNPGTLKWPIKADQCYKVWQMKGGTFCSNCIRSCPFNKVDSWLHEVTRVLIGAKSGSIDKLLLKMDDASAYGRQAEPEKFWKKKKDYIHT